MKARLCPLLALLVLAVPALPAPAHAHPSAAEQLMVKHINNARSAYGVPPLRRSGSLTRSSHRFGRYLLRVDRFGHASAIRASRRFRRLGEVLAYHRGDNALIRATVGRWMRSPGHRSAILSPRFRYVGAGKVRGRFGRMRATTWVMQLGR